MFCTNCGANISAASRFCPNCGAPFAGVPAAPVPPKKKKTGLLIALLAAVLAAAVFCITAFAWPGFLKKDSGSAPEETAAPAEASAGSEAFTLQVQEGVTVSAPENALYPGTEFTVTPVTEADDGLLAIEEDFRGNGRYLFAAWEISAGLEPDEHLPEDYEFRVDLSAFELPEELYEDVRFFRVTDDGRIFEYDTALDGATASFRSNQNSVSFGAIVVSGAKALGGAATVVYDKVRAIEQDSAEYYFTTKPGEKPCITEGKNFRGSYSVMWYASDVDPSFAEVMDKLDEIRERVRKQTEEDLLYESSSILSIFRTNASKAEAVEKALAKDREYTKLLATLKTPPFIARFTQLLDDAYRYLGSVAKIAMPNYRVKFYLKPELDVRGREVWNVVSSSYIDIRADSELVSTAGEGGEVWDNLLLTVTHELFHICQERYHTAYFTDVEKFDEMTAVLLEYDAFNYYTENYYIDSKPELTVAENAYWDTLRFPMDKMGLESDGDRQHGYCLARFIIYLREKTGTQVTAKQLMDSRHYLRGPNISDPLKSCFALTDDLLETYYKSFIIENRETVATSFNSVFPFDKTKNVLKNGGSLRFVPEFTGPLCVTGSMVKLESPGAAVYVFPDAELAQSHPGMMLVPTEPYERVKDGTFLPAQAEGTNKGSILEICGNAYTANAAAGYTVYSVARSAAPVAAVNGTELTLTLPAPDAVYADGRADGFIAELVFPAGTVTKEIAAASFGKSETFDLAKLAPAGTEGEVEVSVTYTPVVSFADKAKTSGLKSEATTVTVNLNSEPAVATEPPKPPAESGTWTLIATDFGQWHSDFDGESNVAEELTHYITVDYGGVEHHAEYVIRTEQPPTVLRGGESLTLKLSVEKTGSTVFWHEFYSGYAIAPGEDGPDQLTYLNYCFRTENYDSSYQLNSDRPVSEPFRNFTTEVPSGIYEGEEMVLYLKTSNLYTRWRYVWKP